jgi:5-methylthioribose kinase
LRTKDLALKQKIERLGSLYLSKGSIYCTGITIRKLVKTADGSKVIDLSFVLCLREFDLGVISPFVLDATRENQLLH